MEFNFNDHLQVDNLEKIPEQFRALYTPSEDGNFTLSKDEKVVGAVSAITGLAKALTASRAEAKANKGVKVDLSPLADFGETPETIAATVRSQLDGLQAELAKGGEAKINLDTIKADLAKAHSTDLQSKDGEIEALKSSLYTYLVENRAHQDIVSSGGVPELLMPVLKQNLRPVVEEGKYTVRVVDNEGNVRYSGITGEAMTPAERVAELKADEKFGRAFASEAPSGGGAAPSKAVVTRPTDGEMSSVSKISAGMKTLRPASGFSQG